MVGVTVTCTASSTAVAGQYANNSNVVGTPLANDGSPLLGEGGVPVPNVTDQDPSAYFGPEASIDIEKDTNGNQADVIADQDILSIGSPITWTFVVTTTGNVDVADVVVSDTVTTITCRDGDATNVLEHGQPLVSLALIEPTK